MFKLHRIEGYAIISEDSMLANAEHIMPDSLAEANKQFIASMRKYFGANVPIGFYAACLYVNGQIVEAALEKTGGKSNNSTQFIKAIKSVSPVSTPRGPVSIDGHGNIVFDCYIRRIDKVNGKLVNKTVKTYPKVSQSGPTMLKRSWRSQCSRAISRP